ncbi:MAG: BamA/TamA family outer membrane protein [Rhodopirellula sp.]|nr:BamA/TamA family outer membrane protein [Rhodopirellula sp.]
MRLLLPHYQLDIDLDTDGGEVHVDEIVTWTNPGPVATRSLVFHVVPNNQPDAKTLAIAERTVESLRLDPRKSIDREGRRFHLKSVRQGKHELESHFDPDADTHLHVQLLETVQPGQSVEVTLRFDLDLPPKQGRLGQHKGVTNLLNWYPILAAYGDQGWDAVPFIPWHQPWLNEAGVYNVRLRLCPGQEAATGGHVVSRIREETGHSILNIEGYGLRDFTIVASERFEVYETVSNGIPIRVLAFPEHQGHARLSLQIAAECIEQYSGWFGPYPYQEFELVESYFGWNGNESSGLVMIDERILDVPQLAGRYVEHLVSHEICHQWWYSAVGTDGYREPWMDEGLAQWLTRFRMEEKYGPNAEVLDLPGGSRWGLPNIPYRGLVHSGYALYAGRGGDGKTLASLDELKHLHNLFFLVYDKGARIVGMIQHRLGRERFFGFLRLVYSEYRFRILRVKDFQRLLEEYSGESWEQFFDDWLRSSRTCDWKIADVNTVQEGDKFRTVARVVQTGDIAEPIEVAIHLGSNMESEEETIVEAMPGIAGLAERQWNEAHTRQIDEKTWEFSFVTDRPPSQVAIDPNSWVIDQNPGNNDWKRDFDVRYSPLYTPLDEAMLMQPFEKPAVVFGPGFDRDGRIGVRGSLIASNQFRISPFVAYTTQTGFEHLSAGVDSVFYNIPWPNWQLGMRYEHGLLTNINNTPGNQGKLYVRKVLAYTTSLIRPNLSYFDLYTRIGDNFFPDADTTAPAAAGIADYRNIRAFGATFHMDSRLPYWNPRSGFLFDTNYEHGFIAFGDGQTYDRVDGQFSVVQGMPEGYGYFSETRIAARVAGGYGWSSNGQHYRFGGPGRFRGLRADDTEGNAFWLTSLEYRFPVTGEMDLEVVDNFAALRSISASMFYDVGESFLFNKSQGGINQAVGGGLYFDLPLLSFVETVTFRVEYGYSLERQAGVFWFGLFHAF